MVSFSLPQRGRGTAAGFSNANEVSVWGSCEAVDEEIEFAEINKKHHIGAFEKSLSNIVLVNCINLII